MKKKKFSGGLIGHIKKRPALYLMILPGLLWFIIFCYVPMYGVVIAFKDYSIGQSFFAGKWIGLRHFVSFVNDPYFFRLMKNTFLLGFYDLLWGFPLPIIFALLLNEMKANKFKGAVQTISYLPYFISTVIIVGMMFSILSIDGVVNTFLSNFGIKPVLFFSEPGWFRTLYVASGIWQGLGWNSIIYLAAISGINPELYESAKIDGASRFRQAVSITVPCIIPTISILLIMKIGSVLNISFEKVYLLYSPSTYETADIIGTYVYRRGFLSYDYSYSTAVGLFQSGISLILLSTANYFSKKLSESSLW